MIPRELDKVVIFLSEQNIELPKQGTDSRHDSATGESHIVQIIQNDKGCRETLSIYSPNVGQRTNRAWYDVKVKDYFCNIKISTLKTNDNTNAKKAIYYFLTGENPESLPSQESHFFKKLKENERACEKRDYYYIVVNKNNTRDIFAVSLKNIAELSPASSNPPFQCCWSKCREPVERTWNEAKKFLLGKWAESIERKMENTKKGMPHYYPEFFEK